MGCWLAGVGRDCGFTSRASVAAFRAAGIPFLLDFARSVAIRERLAHVGPQQRRWLRDGGVIHVGECPWDSRLRLFAIGARAPGDQRGPWVYSPACAVAPLQSVPPRVCQLPWAQLPVQVAA